MRPPPLRLFQQAGRSRGLFLHAAAASWTPGPPCPPFSEASAAAAADPVAADPLATSATILRILADDLSIFLRRLLIFADVWRASLARPRMPASREDDSLKPAFGAPPPSPCLIASSSPAAAAVQPPPLPPFLPRPRPARACRPARPARSTLPDRTRCRRGGRNFRPSARTSRRSACAPPAARRWPHPGRAPEAAVGRAGMKGRSQCARSAGSAASAGRRAAPLPPSPPPSRPRASCRRRGCDQARASRRRATGRRRRSPGRRTPCRSCRQTPQSRSLT